MLDFFRASSARQFLQQILFQINSEFPSSTVDQLQSLALEERRRLWRLRRIAWLESGLILLILVCFAGQPTPGVNEAHYLTKAKHFWNPEWCPNDLFLNSTNSHWLFYFCFGWLTKFLSLESVAWIGRIISWGVIAWGWQRLSWRLMPTLLVAPFAAILFCILNDRFQLAGEWVVGGFEAKGVAYGLLLIGLSEMVIGKWRLAWLWIAASTGMHLLVGGWGGIACMIAMLMSQRTLRQEMARSPITGVETMKSFQSAISYQRWTILIFFLTGILAAMPTLLGDRNVPSAVKVEGLQIYVHERISHHLIFSSFRTSDIARFTLLVVAWFAVYRWCRNQWPEFKNLFRSIGCFTISSLLFSLIGLVLSGLAEPESKWNEIATGLLRFYWFRLSDFAVPASFALMIAFILVKWWRKPADRARRFASLFAAVMLLAAGFLSVKERWSDPRPRGVQLSLVRSELGPEQALVEFEQWKNVCRWIRDNTPGDARFITPNQQQTFKWYAERSEVVNWKDIPQDAGSVVKWHERVKELLIPQQQYAMGMLSYSDDQLRSIGEKHNANYLVVSGAHSSLASDCALKRVYPEKKNSSSGFVVFELPKKK